MNLVSVKLKIPDGWNIIFGQSHFIKTAEDIHELLVTGSAGLKFGVAFSEASSDRLIRHSGNDAEAERVAVDNLKEIGAGHTFLVALKEGYPIYVLNAIKDCPEVCRIFCATANPMEVILAVTDQGRGVLGVVDGFPPVGVENDEQITWRKQFLRKIGYKS